MHAFREMSKYIENQIAEHEHTFDVDNIRDFVDIFLRLNQCGDEKDRAHITSK